MISAQLIDTIKIEQISNLPFDKNGRPLQYIGAKSVIVCACGSRVSSDPADVAIVSTHAKTIGDSGRCL
jgi:hypothetical protein